MVLETARLLLREYTLADIDVLFEILSDAETMQYCFLKLDITFIKNIGEKGLGAKLQERLETGHLKIRNIIVCIPI